MFFIQNNAIFKHEFGYSCMLTSIIVQCILCISTIGVYTG